jgi:hypothetical protein
MGDQLTTYHPNITCALPEATCCIKTDRQFSFCEDIASGYKTCAYKHKSCAQVSGVYVHHNNGPAQRYNACVHRYNGSAQRYNDCVHGANGYVQGYNVHVQRYDGCV